MKDFNINQKNTNQFITFTAKLGAKQKIEFNIKRNV